MTCLDVKKHAAPQRIPNGTILHTVSNKYETLYVLTHQLDESIKNVLILRKNAKQITPTKVAFLRLDLKRLIQDLLKEKYDKIFLYVP